MKRCHWSAWFLLGVAGVVGYLHSSVIADTRGWVVSRQPLRSQSVTLERDANVRDALVVTVKAANGATIDELWFPDISKARFDSNSLAVENGPQCIRQAPSGQSVCQVVAREPAEVRSAQRWWWCRTDQHGRVTSTLTYSVPDYQDSVLTDGCYYSGFLRLLDFVALPNDEFANLWYRYTMECGTERRELFVDLVTIDGQVRQRLIAHSCFAGPPLVDAHFGFPVEAQMEVCDDGVCLDYACEEYAFTVRIAADAAAPNEIAMHRTDGTVFKRAFVTQVLPLR
jgi:hypothetical protein